MYPEKAALGWAPMGAVTVTTDFKFQTAVHTKNGRLLTGIEKERSPETRSIWQPPMRDSADSGIDIHVRRTSVPLTTLRIFA